MVLEIGDRRNRQQGHDLMPFNFKQYADITGQHEMALAAQVGREAAEKDALAASQRQQQIGLQARGQEIQYQTHLDNLMARRFSEERQQEYQKSRDLEQREFQRERDEEAERRDIGAFRRTEKGRVAAETRAEERREEGSRDAQTKTEANSLTNELNPNNFDDPDDKTLASKYRKELRKIESDPTLSTPAARIEARQKLIQTIRNDGILAKTRAPSPIQAAYDSGQAHTGTQLRDYLDREHEKSGGEGVSPLLTPQQRDMIDDGAILEWEGGRNGAPLTPKLVWPEQSPEQQHENEVELKELEAYNKNVIKREADIAKRAAEIKKEVIAAGGTITDAEAKARATKEYPPISKPSRMTGAEDRARDDKKTARRERLAAARAERERRAELKKTSTGRAELADEDLDKVEDADELLKDISGAEEYRGTQKNVNNLNWMNDDDLNDLKETLGPELFGEFERKVKNIGVQEAMKSLRAEIEAKLTEATDEASVEGIAPTGGEPEEPLDFAPAAEPDPDAPVADVEKEGAVPVDPADDPEGVVAKPTAGVFPDPRPDTPEGQAAKSQNKRYSDEAQRHIDSAEGGKKKGTLTHDGKVWNATVNPTLVRGERTGWIILTRIEYGEAGEPTKRITKHFNLSDWAKEARRKARRANAKPQQ